MSHWTSSSISAAYAAFRPSYPAELFAAIARRCTSGKDLCVDVGCGSGQGAVPLAQYFRHVVGVDPSPSQVANAAKHDRVTYCVGGAETFSDASLLTPPITQASHPFWAEASNGTSNPNVLLHSADCVTVAQAIHWFHMPSFLQQVDRVLKSNAPGTLLAFWSYPLCTVTSHPKIDQLLKDMDSMLMSGGYWPQERKHVDNHYADIWTEENFLEVMWTRDVEVFPVEKAMSLGEFVSYLSTMSGVSRYQAKHKDDKDILDAFFENAAAIISALAEEDSGEKDPRQTPLTVVFQMETYFATRK